MLTTTRAASWSGSGHMRPSVAQSTATSTRSATSGGGASRNTSPGATMNSRSLGTGGRVGVREHDVLAGRAQGARQAEQGADGITVGVVVRGDHEPLAGPGEHLGDLGARRVPGHARAHACSSSMGSGGGAGGRSAVTSSMKRVSSTASRWVVS